MASITEALLGLTVALVIIYASTMLFKRHKNLPPGPMPLPIIGCLHLLGTHPHISLDALSRKYGPVMSVQLGQKLCIIATSATAAKEFLKVQDANFCFRPYVRAHELIMPNDLILNNVTPVFRHLRKILFQELTSAKRLQTSKHVRTEEIAYMLQSISKETGAFHLYNHLHVMTTNVLCRMILNKRFLGSGDQSHDFVTKTAKSEMHEFTHIREEMAFAFTAIHPQDFFNIIPMWFDPQGLDARFRKIRERMDSFYSNMIHQHMELRKRNPISEKEYTLLDVLLAQIDNPEQQVTAENIRDMVWDVFAAGTETTILTNEWTMAELIRNPAVIEKAQAEVDSVVGLNRTVQESDLPELPYIHAIVKESLRLHAPLSLLIPHQSNTACKVFGYDIPAETRVMINIWSIARDPEIWENPSEFVPERFLPGGKHATTEFQGQHFEFTPFGSGRRSCPGMALGTLSMHLQVSSLIHAFDWSLPNGLAPEKVDMTEKGGFEMQLQTRLSVIAKPRLPSHLY